MIYITCWDKESDALRLYSEWTAKEKLGSSGTNDILIVAKEDKRIIGALQLYIINDTFWNRKWGLIENIYVSKEFRRKGIARKLMAFAELEASMFGCEFVKLTSSHDKKEAHELYQSLDYVQGYSFKKELR